MLGFAVRVLLLSVSLSLLVATAAAQDPVVRSADIEKALKQDKPRTRSFTRAVSVRPKVDLYVPFEFNSTKLDPEAETQLAELSKALSSDTLGAYRFEVAGHTDAAGADDYNRTLSRQRAETVMQYLLDSGISRERLEAVGYGEEKLLHKDKPMDPANRRVEIRNIGTVKP